MTRSIPLRSTSTCASPKDAIVYTFIHTIFHSFIFSRAQNFLSGDKKGNDDDDDDDDDIYCDSVCRVVWIENAREIKRFFLLVVLGILGQKFDTFLRLEVHRSRGVRNHITNLGAVAFRADLSDIDGMMRPRVAIPQFKVLHSAKVWGNLDEGTRNVLRVSKDTPSIDRVVHVG